MLGWCIEAEWSKAVGRWLEEKSSRTEPATGRETERSRSSPGTDHREYAGKSTETWNTYLHLLSNNYFSYLSMQTYGYLLVVPHRGSSWRNEKNINTFWLKSHLIRSCACYRRFLKIDNLGPVVQSVVSFTSSLVVKMWTVLVRTMSNSQVFLLKKCE